MSKNKKERPSEFDIAIEKGDYELPKDLPSKRAFEESLSAFIIFWKRLGSPHEWVLYRLLAWEDHQHDRKETADAIGLSGSEAVRQMLRHLEDNFNKNPAPHRHRHQK